MSCARVTGPAWSRRPGPCSRCTSCCGWPWSPPSRPARAPTRTGPASPPRSKPPKTSSPPPKGSARTAQPTYPARSAAPCWPRCCPPGPRRPRYSARKVKCATSRYLNREDGRPAHPTTITAIDIAICTPPVDLKPGRTHRNRRTTPRPPQPPTRREKITAIITGQPPRDWSGHELAILLGVKPRNMLTQLGEWTRLGFFTRTGFGTYKLNTPPASTPSTIPPDP